MTKTTMELVWHNCADCPPQESSNDDLYLWDGYSVYPVEWRDGHFVDYLRPGLTINTDLKDFWWADLSQTTGKFFKK